MSDTCEVVTIETENGDVEINKSDFDEKKHTLAGQKKEAKKEDKPKAEKQKKGK